MERRGPPEPVRPAFDGACLVNLVPALLEPLEGRLGGRRSPAPLADWVPEAVAGAEQIVLLVVDGLGALQLDERRDLAPTLASGGGARMTSVAPSTTATALTSLTTGRPPALHGVVGYRVAAAGGVLNVLRWTVDGMDARRRIPAAQFQRMPAFAGRLVPVVSRAEYAATGFSAAHLGQTPLHGWQTASGIAVEIHRVLQAGAPFVYAYYDGLDRTSHAHGLGGHYDAELRACDRLVADVRDVLPAGAALVVTADHGQVDVGGQVETPGAALMAGVTLCSGEGRFRWLHVREGAAEDVAAAAQECFGSVAWVWTRDQLIDEGWLGGNPTPDVADRLGDVVVAPYEPTAILDPADTGEQRLVGRHGSLTEAEMLVPLLGWASER